MATKKKVSKKGPGTPKGHVHSEKKPTAAELRTATKRMMDIASGKKAGLFVILEKFEENGKVGIQGMSYAHQTNAQERIQALVSAMHVPVPVVMAVLAMLGND